MRGDRLLTDVVKDRRTAGPLSPAPRGRDPHPSESLTVHDDDAFPTTYEQWRHCLEVRGRVRLTPGFVSDRLSEMQDPSSAKTREFARLYGNEHLERVIAWFRRATKELS